MDGRQLDETPMLDKLLGLKISTDLKWDAYIRSVAKDVARMVVSFYRSKRFLCPESILYLYKSQVRPKMEYCSHIWAGASKTALSSLDRLHTKSIIITLL